MNKKIKIIIILILCSYFVGMILVNIIGKKINPTIRSYSMIEAERFGNYMINQSLNKKFMNELNLDIFDNKLNSNGEIQMIDFKSKEVNILLEKISNNIQTNLINLENGKADLFELADTFQGLRFKKIKKGIICEIPAGIIYDNALLSNVGPVVPIKLNFIGHVITNVKTKVHTYGINSIYLEVYIHVELTERITMPLRTEKKVVSTDIPLTIKIIQGKIPNYYQYPIYQNSQEFTLPIN